MTGLEPIAVQTVLSAGAIDRCSVFQNVANNHGTAADCLTASDDGSQRLTVGSEQRTYPRGRNGVTTCALKVYLQIR